MLTKRQIVMLALLGLAMWALVTLNIRLRPQSVIDPVYAAVGFAIAPFAGWLSVRLCQIVGRLSAGQLMAGVCLTGAVAMMVDGVVLKWFPTLYGSDERTLRLAAAWLLWGYGVAFVAALLMEMHASRRGQTAVPAS